VNYPVCAIAVSGSDLYVGGEFTQAGGIPANHFARWDGSSWSALGGGVNDFVYAIVVSGSDVYAGGRFTEAGGNLANNIARWDDLNDTWFSLGSGVNDAVTAIAVSGSDVYVGGDFSEAGGSPANYIARWFDDSVGTEPPTGEVIPGGSLSLRASPNPTAAGIELSFLSTGLSPLTLDIYDAAGHLVKTQDLGTLPSGSQTHYWDGLDGNGHALAQGVYFLRLSSADLEASTRVVLLR
ncbi:MAG TPA: FlgD immunoglobulin-like domain containing protein, partial [Candidatus Fermentibacter sp.]|nr:FlgD immunoglobulin-like domain containing protein [Candidatus Fermentibacter sp.]